MKQVISQSTIYSQGYTPLFTDSNGNKAAKFSETFTISKIPCESNKDIVISNINVLPQDYENSQALDNIIQLAFILANGLEFTYSDITHIDNGEGNFYELFNGQKNKLTITPDTQQINSPKKFIYFSIPLTPIEINDTDLIKFAKSKANNDIYRDNSSYSKIQDRNISLMLPLTKTTYSLSNSKFHIENSSNKKYLYIIPFVPRLQENTLIIATQIIFDLEF